MSQWTHVVAVICFDGIIGLTPDPDLGRTVSWDNEDEGAWERCDVPHGSEGSLNYTLREVGDGMPRFVATIWGDLRDYSDTDEIKAYLARIVAGQMIRSGIAEINVERGDTIVLACCPNDDTVGTVWRVVECVTPTKGEKNGETK